MFGAATTTAPAGAPERRLAVRNPVLSARTAMRRRHVRSKTDCRPRRDSDHARARRPMARRSPEWNRSARRSRSWNERDRARAGPARHRVVSSASSSARIGQSLGTRIRAQGMMDQQDAERLLGGKFRQDCAERVQLACVRAIPSPSRVASGPPRIRRSARADRGGVPPEMSRPDRPYRRRPDSRTRHRQNDVWSCGHRRRDCRE